MAALRPCVVSGWVAWLALAATAVHAQEKKIPGKGIDPATVAAYQKLGAEYGGLLNLLKRDDPRGAFYFGQKQAEAGLPGFQISTFPKTKFPEVAVPFCLNLFTSDVTDVGLKELAPLKNLTYLDLTSTSVSDAGLKELAPLKNLTTLLLSKTKVTDAGLKDLAPLKNLTILFLPREISNAGLKDLAPLKNLTALELSFSRVTDAGLKDLALFKNLTWLSLSRTSVTDAGLKDLASLKNLTLLSLQGTNVTKEGVAELRKALPKCKIVH